MKRSLPTIIAIGILVIIIVGMVIYSNDVDNFSLSFFGTGLSIDKK